MRVTVIHWVIAVGFHESWAGLIITSGNKYLKISSRIMENLNRITVRVLTPQKKTCLITEFNLIYMIAPLIYWSGKYLSAFASKTLIYLLDHKIITFKCITAYQFNFCYILPPQSELAVESFFLQPYTGI